MIGIIPAAGLATRLNGLPKFLLPIPGGTLLERLIQQMKRGGVSNTDIRIGTNPHTSPMIPTVHRDVGYTKTMSSTVLALRENDHPVLFGMPDAYWDDDTVYERLAADINAGAMVSVALFNVSEEQRNRLGMCKVAFADDVLHVRRIEDKPQNTTLHLAWGALAWSADFWQYIRPTDPHVGYAVQRAIEDGIPVRGQLFTGGYWDCGTLETYYECLSHLMEVARV